MRTFCQAVSFTFYWENFTWPPSTIVPSTHYNCLADVTFDNSERGRLFAHASILPLTCIMHYLVDITLGVADMNQNG